MWIVTERKMPDQKVSLPGNAAGQGIATRPSSRPSRGPQHRAHPLPEEPDEAAQQAGSNYPSRWHSGQVSRPKAAFLSWQAPHCLPRSIAA